MRSTLYGPPPADVDQLAGEYEELMAAEVDRTVRLTASLLSPVPTQDDLAILPTLWRGRVEDRLGPTLRLLWLVGGATIRGQLDQHYGVGRGITAAVKEEAKAANQLLLGYTDEQLAEAYLTAAEDRVIAASVWIWAHARDKILEGLRHRQEPEEIAERIHEATGLALPKAKQLARNEVHDALQYASYAQVLALGLPGEKEWVGIIDSRIRDDHLHADGQRVGLRERFEVGGWPMDRPHDPGAPAEETVNCRCTLRFDLDLPESEAPAGRARATIERRRRADQRVLRRAYTRGVVKKGIAREELEELLRTLSDFGLESGIGKVVEGGEQIRYAEVAEEAEELAREVAEAAEANLEGSAAGPDWYALAAAADTKTGAMIALLPDDPEALELQSDEAEPAGQLHLTLAYLGDGADWSAAQREALLDRLAFFAGGPPVHGHAFGVAHWNTDGDEPSVVLNLGGEDGLEIVHDLVWDVLRDLEGDQQAPELPAQHTPWIPHVCLAYSQDPELLRQAAPLVGATLTFTALRVAFAGEMTDLKLTGNDDDEGALAAAVETYREAFHPGHADQKVHGRRWGRTVSDRMRRSGGITIHRKSGWEPHEGMALSPYPDRELKVPLGRLDGPTVRDYLDKNRDLLGKPDHFLGGWLDRDTGTAYLDVSVLAKTKGAADRLAREHHQLAYFDLKTGEEHRV